MPRIAVIPGDGIGIDVTREAVKVMNTINEVTSLNLKINQFDFGAEKYLKTGISIPKETFKEFRSNYDAIFLGALGDPRIPDMTHARDILMGLRFEMDLYVNQRPVRLYDPQLCPLKNKVEKDIQFIIFRENTEGMYVGMGGIFKKGREDEIAIQESINTRRGVERIIRYSFEYARSHNLQRVTMSDKSNVLRYGHDLWQRVFQEIGEEYPDIQKQHLYIDALVMQMLKKPEQFDVIVTCNMFGDIISDLGAQLQGGLGLAPSGNINPGVMGMFEPVHGSAPKYAGKNVANPLGAILSVEMMLDFLGYKKQASLIEQSVIESIKKNWTTRDLGGSLGTGEVGDYICSFLSQLAG